MKNDGFLKHDKFCKELLSYQKSVIIYDCTYIFCERFLKKRDRTVDQMVQAARSGKQNIIEGAKAATTSTETEIKLTSVARASLEELLEDYHDFLRARKLPLWNKNNKQASYVRRLSSGKIEPLTPDEIYLRYGNDGNNGNDVAPQVQRNSTNDSNFEESHNLSPIHQAFIAFLETRPPDICANIMICLINQCNYLLDKQIARLEQTFTETGGLRERMYNARKDYRKNN
jgi:four helix bundle suffix protein